MYLEMDPKLKDISVISDPTKITQVLSNLMNNALSFTEKGSVSLSVSAKPISNTTLKVYFSIQDTGIGIAMNRQESIFEPYVQAASNTTRHYGGTGLGLPIVKKILAMFKSQLQLESTPNMGTKISFDIDLEYEVSTESVVTDQLTGDVDIGHLRILVAEDNEVNKLVIKKTLEQWNIVPEIAKNGAVALKKLKQGNFDLILMDLFMPIMDGYEATAKIRKLKDPSKSDIPIIALTAQFDEKVAQKVLKATMDDYLSKPFNPDHLYEKLKMIADSKVEIFS
ncbi:response regulator [Gelidibacter mesophilus]|uniref:response regulator n=1 Tax=Gelidibacter mesophilus TaxID=169050 RepID=UPI001B7F7D97|nr:response regulator [Gelidibacter mesophilus]